MARPIETYPETQGLPAECTDEVTPYIRVDPLVVVVPYRGIDEVQIEIPGIISAEDPLAHMDLFAPLHETWDDQGPGSLGWDSETENDIYIEATGAAEEILAQAGDMPMQSGRVRALATDAMGMLDRISDIYRQFESGVTYPLKGGVWVPYDLSVPDEVLADHLDPEEAGIWDIERHNRRQDIRRLWDHALSLLWCARFGMAQVESYVGNELAYLDGGGGLAYDTGSNSPPGGVTPRSAPRSRAPVPSTPVDTWGDVPSGPPEPELEPEPEIEPEIEPEPELEPESPREGDTSTPRGERGARGGDKPPKRARSSLVLWGAIAAVGVTLGMIARR